MQGRMPDGCVRGRMYTHGRYKNRRRAPTWREWAAASGHASKKAARHCRGWEDKVGRGTDKNARSWKNLDRA